MMVASLGRTRALLREGAAAPPRRTTKQPRAAPNTSAAWRAQPLLASDESHDRKARSKGHVVVGHAVVPAAQCPPGIVLYDGRLVIVSADGPARMHGAVLPWRGAGQYRQ